MGSEKDTGQSETTGINPVNVIRRLLGKPENDSRVQPYVSFKDLNNGPDTNWENEPRPAIEAGIKISF